MSDLRDIYERVFQFACGVVRLHRELIHIRGTNRVAANQLLRAGTAIGANLEEANGANSKADFIAKTRISLKEARESNYWLRLIEATEGLTPDRINPLVRESHEIVAILTSIVKNASSSPQRHSSF